MKSYIYRNLRDKKWSVKERNRVIYRGESFCLSNVTFQVSDLGRQRVLREKRKNVHAYVVATDFRYPGPLVQDSCNEEISYNPYKSGSFYRKSDNQPITKADAVLLTPNGKVFALNPE